jgi:hypothetical protein
MNSSSEGCWRAQDTRPGLSSVRLPKLRWPIRVEDRHQLKSIEKGKLPNGIKFNTVIRTVEILRRVLTSNLFNSFDFSQRTRSAWSIFEPALSSQIVHLALIAIIGLVLGIFISKALDLYQIQRIVAA